MFKSNGLTRVSDTQFLKGRKYKHTLKTSGYRGIDFNLSPEEFLALVSKPCTYCGKMEVHKRYHHTKVPIRIDYNGIDRVDPTKGYEVTNCVSCCWTCNRAKGVLTAEQFTEWRERLVKTFLEQHALN